MKRQVAQYLYDIGDVYSILRDAVDGISEAHIDSITDSALHSFLSALIFGVGIDNVYQTLGLYTPESHVAEIVSDLIEWYDDCVGRHLRAVTPPNASHGFYVGGNRTDLTITIYQDVPPPPDNVGKIKQLIQNDLDNGDFYPENIRHALGLH